MKTSAGILLFKREKNTIFYFLVHPGGPFWKNKHSGTWSIPKGEPLPNENLLERALIEFKEETGKSIIGEFIELTPVKQKGGKTVYAWAVEGNIDLVGLTSNTIKIKWPPKFDKMIEIPEVDEWEWFDSDEAKNRINPAQVSFIIELEELLEQK
ncbi:MULTISPECIES: NUDIX domain-containing protein [Chryseobacterium]|uniref:NUDIX family NTP pyrophosphohydrolase n=1 Tax=Chryseobacterium geocarposphaerae TaxID=1416776 RepID=A0ABU1LFH4_9FLAO|nr:MULTISPECIES: NUDIX domain-containing protein [Chryseobacterium]MDR6405468.1 putative NUDIX family NTP pyrophosphohydrolase [Chryseobacterium geocarposphaerae]MDR6698699.1 putative NUDIX family NTP pyrophosphohydrolase [Chryseobacterium ginsenosidimutans]